MRIVAGKWRGRTLVAPRGRSTRPTSDRVREALFDVLTARLGPSLQGAVVLDLYAGTGALGLEAISRGAGRAVLVERDDTALRALDANVTALGAQDAVSIVAGDVAGAGLDRALALGPFTLLLLDPPYRIEASDVASALERCDSVLSPRALVAWEHAAFGRILAPAGWELSRTYRYGDSAVSILHRVQGGSGA